MRGLGTQGVWGMWVNRAHRLELLVECSGLAAAAAGAVLRGGLATAALWRRGRAVPPLRALAVLLGVLGVLAGLPLLLLAAGAAGIALLLFGAIVADALTDAQAAWAARSRGRPGAAPAPPLEGAGRPPVRRGPERRPSMYARITPTRFDPARGAEVLRGIQEQALPVLRQLPGFRHHVALVDRATGRSYWLTLWDTAEQAAALRTALSGLMGQDQILDVRFAAPEAEGHKVLAPD